MSVRRLSNGGSDVTASARAPQAGELHNTPMMTRTSHAVCVILHIVVPWDACNLGWSPGETCQWTLSG